MRSASGMKFNATAEAVAMVRIITGVVHVIALCGT
jgi:hypothetical protein